MKIRLPSSLKKANIEKVASDDLSCVSDGSSDNKSVLSFLSSRSRLKANRKSRRPRLRTKSFLESKTSKSNVIASVTATTGGGGAAAAAAATTSPTKNIMKRIQKSFSSSSLNKKFDGPSRQESVHGGCSDIGSDQEKENATPSSNARRMHSPNADFPAIDSTVVSIADLAVAVNFPSSCIQPIPIKQEDIDLNSALVGTDVDENLAREIPEAKILGGECDDHSSPEIDSNTRRIMHDNTIEFTRKKLNYTTKGDDFADLQKPADGCANFSSNKISSTRNNTTDLIAKRSEQSTNETTTKTLGAPPVILEKENEGTNDDGVNCDECEIKGVNKSPSSAATFDSLLPPLQDDDELSQKLLFPTHETVDSGIGVRNDPEQLLLPERRMARAPTSEIVMAAIVKPATRMAKPATSENVIAEIVKPLSSQPIHNLCVSSPLSEGSCRQSLNSSFNESSADRSSFIFDSDDESDDHTPYLTKPTFEPPREVVTITLGSVPAQSSKPPYKVQGRQHQHGDSPNPLQAENKRRSDQRKKASNNAIDNEETEKTIHEVDTEDDEKRTAQELALRLSKDLEEMREENEKFASKNRRLETKLQILKAQQDEHMVHRGRLIKACLYTAPVFVLCGGLDTFLATILLVWVLVEVDGYLDGSEGNDDGGEDGGYVDDVDDEGDDASTFHESLAGDASSMSL